MQIDDPEAAVAAAAYVPDWIRRRSALWADLVANEEEGEADVAADATARNAAMPVCAEDCMDGALMLRVTDYWCVPHDALHTASFCRAWFALSAETRNALLAQQTNTRNKKLDDPVLGANSLTAAAIALDNVALLATIPVGEVVAAITKNDSGGETTATLQDLCMQHDAIECMALLGMSSRMVDGMEPAARAGAAKILRHMFMLHRDSGRGFTTDQVERLMLAAMGSARGVAVLEEILQQQFPSVLERHLAWRNGNLMEVAVGCGHWHVFCWMVSAVRAAIAKRPEPGLLDYHTARASGGVPPPFDPASLLYQLTLDRRTTEIARLQKEFGCDWRFSAKGHYRPMMLADEDGMTVCELAARHGRLDVLAWAKASGCPWDKDRLRAAARSDRTRSAITKLDAGLEITTSRSSNKKRTATDAALTVD